MEANWKESPLLQPEMKMHVYELGPSRWCLPLQSQAGQHVCSLQETSAGITQPAFSLFAPESFMKSREPQGYAHQSCIWGKIKINPNRSRRLARSPDGAAGMLYGRERDLGRDRLLLVAVFCKASLCNSRSMSHGSMPRSADVAGPLRS